MSGSLTTDDVEPDLAATAAAAPELEITESRVAQVGSMPVRRALPRRERRTVGAWCFLDHAGPMVVSMPGDVGIGPHPHLGLQTVTWLLSGEMLHRDGLGSEQVIRPGQLNLMTAGHGVVHAEDGTGKDWNEFHAVQLWVAQPEATRNGAAAFEHHAELPRGDVGGATVTVLIGELAGLRSTARRDTEHFGAELDIRSATTLPLRADFEHALVVLTGAVTIEGRAVSPGHLAYLGRGREELQIAPAEAPARAMLLGGVPFESPVLMWWNYVARTREEISEAHREWTARTDRFAVPKSANPAIDVPPPPWETA